jgi:hypothetical protein
MTAQQPALIGPRSWRRAIWPGSAPLLKAFVAGGLTGAVAAGFGSRIVMRVIALADPDTDGTFTDAEATVGEFTVGGTLNLVLLGTVAGIMGGAVYLGLRRWLPVPAQWRGLAYGAVTLVTVGNLLFDPHNADFQIFEPVLMVIALFSLLFFVNGLLISWLLDRVQPEPVYRPSVWTPRLAAGLIGLVCVFGSVGIVGGTIDMVDDEGTCISARGGGAGCAVRAGDS